MTGIFIGCPRERHTFFPLDLRLRIGLSGAVAAATLSHGGTVHNGNHNIYGLGTVPSKTHSLIVRSVVLCLTIKVKVRVRFIRLNHSYFLAQPTSFLSQPGVMAE